MKWMLTLIGALALAACAPIQSTPSLNTNTPTLIVPSTTASPAPSAIASATPLPTATFTPAPPPCDPYSVDYCITAGHFVFQRPILDPLYDSVDPTYRYGSTAGGSRETHHGVEFPAPFGFPVYAAGDGEVIFAGPDNDAVYSPWPKFYGNLIVIQHADQLYTLYAHLSKLDVEARQTVKAGDKIGEVGMTGVALGPHLHFEVRDGNHNGEDYYQTSNPELWLIPKENSLGEPFGALVLAVVNAQQHYQFTPVTLQYYPDPNGDPQTSYDFTTYTAEVTRPGDNAGIGDLPPGRYRITLIFDGHLYERWVDVQSGKLTQVVIVVK